MKKLSSFLLTLALVFTLIPAFAVGATAEAPVPAGHIDIPADAATVEKDGITYTVLRTEGDLAFLTTENGRFILANDIDFGGRVPERYTVSGVIFDGNGYSYLNFKLESTGDTSLFANNKGAESVFRNLNFGAPEQKATVTVSNTAASTGTTGVGVLFSYTNSNFRFENINVYADMTASERICMGGLIGYDNGGTAVLVNCNFYGSIMGSATAKADVGYAGLVGKIGSPAVITLEGCNNYGTISTRGTGNNQKTAGLVGVLNAPVLTMKNCANFGNISSADAGNVGGFISEFYLSPKTELDIRFTDCVNYGTVSGQGKTGGFFGYLNSGTNGVGGTVLFEGCKNYGAMVGTGGDSGGFCGSISAKANIQVLNCANYGDLSGGGNNKAGFCGSINMQTSYTLTVTDYLNTGNVTSGSRAGSVSGWLGAGNYIFTRCVNLGNMNGKGNVGGIMAMAISAAATETAPAYVTTVTDCFSAGGQTSTVAAECGVIVGYASDKATGSGNLYKKFGSAHTSLGDTEMAAWTDVVTKLNELYSEAWGKFILNNDENGVVPATPKLAGVQDGKAADGKLSVRLIATLRDTLRYDEIGFQIRVNGGETNQISCKHVYLKLLSRENGNQTTITADELGGSFVYALAIDSIPATGTVTLTVTPYANDLDYANNGIVYIGVSYNVTYVNGVFQGAVPVAETPAA